MLDILIQNGTVVDGSGLHPREMHVGVTGDRITMLTTKPCPAKTIIDATGLVVAPGFIDTHAHSEFSLLADGRAEGKIAQGVTTEINGNCGLSAAPLYGESFERRQSDMEEYHITERWHTFGEYFALLEARGIALNYATLCGHGNIRGSVVGYVDRPATRDELEIMQDMVAGAMRAGARGISTGLIYPPGMYATMDELVLLMRTAEEHMPGRRLLYATHLRSEGDRLLEAIDEAIGIASRTGSALHVSHLKTSGEHNWHKADAVVSRIKTAFQSGLMVTADRYPYIASSTDLDTILPKWVFDGGIAAEMSRLADPGMRKKIVQEIGLEEPVWRNIMVSSVCREQNAWMEGETLDVIAGKLGKPPVHALMDLLLEEESRTAAIFFSMNEENLKTFLRLPYLMIGSDSSARSFSGVTAKGKPHPRGFGSFPRFLGKYVRDMKLLSLQEAIHKMTQLPAETFGLEWRGLVRTNYFADIVVFDPARLSDPSEFRTPFRRAEGMAHVLVNGVFALRDGELTGALPGRILR
ncbi:MAG: D-aminoacylase [Nitrospiraceae bacterium]|jgi:N-acyl-D-amino-acid deacylase|nr:D-aminoacylase [Nitrospiraceae bacterium]